MSVRVAVVIPAYGKRELTRAVSAQLAADPFPSCTVVVDNAGDYEPVEDETVLRPGENLGWLRGTNLGLRHALADPSFTHFCMLNNDVVLCDGFLAGLVAACDPDTGLVAPSYDDHYEVQTAFFTGPAADFQPAAVEVDADVVDGTCLLAPRAALEQVGLMDERRFGRYGWGGADDLCLRVRKSDLRVVVTRRAYLQHRTGATASTVHTDYRQRALAEMYVGMRRKYGRHWTAEFPSGTFDHHGSGLRELWAFQKVVWTDTSPRLRARRGWAAPPRPTQPPSQEPDS